MTTTHEPRPSMWHAQDPISIVRDKEHAIIGYVTPCPDRTAHCWHAFDTAGIYVGRDITRKLAMTILEGPPHYGVTDQADRP